MNRFVESDKSIDNSEVLNNCSPEDIAKHVFSKSHNNLGTYSMLLDSSTNDGKDPIYIFEILINILMEGLNIFTNGFHKVDFNEIDSEYILGLSPWFKSLGFRLYVDAYHIDDTDMYDNYYCKIIIKNDGNEGLFIMKNISKSYHFFINGNKLEENKIVTNLKDLCGIFICDYVVFNISFDYLI